MGKNGSFDELIKKAEKINKQLAKEVAPEINKLFKESVYDSLIQWYSEYSPNMYQRTNNFMNVYNSAYTHANRNILTMHVDSSKMNDYPGFDIPHIQLMKDKHYLLIQHSIICLRMVNMVMDVG